MAHGHRSDLSRTTQGELAKRNPGMGSTITAKSKRAHSPHTMHRVRDCKVAFTFQSIGRRDKTNPALVPTTGQINERYMPLSGSGWGRVQFKSVLFPKRGSGLKPFDAGPNQKPANCPQGQAEILDMGPQGNILWVIFHTSLCPLSAKSLPITQSF